MSRVHCFSVSISRCFQQLFGENLTSVCQAAVRKKDEGSALLPICPHRVEVGWPRGLSHMQSPSVSLRKVLQLVGYSAVSAVIVLITSNRGSPPLLRFYFAVSLAHCVARPGMERGAGCA